MVERFERLFQRFVKARPCLLAEIAPRQLHRKAGAPGSGMVERFERFSLALFEISRYWHKLAAEGVFPLITGEAPLC